MNTVSWGSVLLVVFVALWFGARALRARAQASTAPAVSPPPCPDDASLLALLELGCDWHWTTDASYRHIAVSSGFSTSTGIDTSTFYAGMPWEIAGLEAGERERASYRRHLERRERARIVLSRRGESGKRSYFEISARPIVRDGQFIGYHGIGRNVTRRVDAERALVESERRYHDVVESVNEVIFQTDIEGRLSFLNGVWLHLTGYRIDRSLGKPLADFLHPDDRPAVEKMLAQVMNGQTAECTCQTRLRTRNGEIRWIEASGRPLEAQNGNFRGIAGTLDDISARKVAELTLKNINQELESRVRIRTAEMEAANRELETFSYSVSHDLRAPLRAIDGFTRILEEDLADRLDATTSGHLERIRRATRRMAHLIDALIELARLTRQSVRKEAVDLSEIALQIIDEIRSEDPLREVEFEVTRDIIVNADRVLVRVMLENLLRNAWKFSAGRSPARIRVGVEMEGDHRVFCVEDNGAGFDMAFASNLFRPFSRLHNSGEFDGTGIGLATVQRIIERHGGTIRAEATPGKGARFYFTL
ncbi:PAS domain S-box protein [Azoarcus sp. L1K30]|uniref:sensor histidine kinase n=1 Tax=Azoarcus sp. L1K30 TaxID=2820277 RepID=UPI0032C23D2A